MQIVNAGQFLQQLGGIKQRYEALFLPMISHIRNKYANNPTGEIPPSINDSLEAHARAFFINAFFEALNWHIVPQDGLPQLIPESPIRSHNDETVRFLDYLGFERNNDIPLLIIEAKRPSIILPQTDLSGLPSKLLSMINGDQGPGNWPEYMTTLQDYVQSVFDRSGEYPKRVVMTNGEWLIIFLEPVTIFTERDATPSTIAVYENINKIEEKYYEVFESLNYYSLIDRTPVFVTLGNLRGYIEGSLVERITLGIRVLYFENPGFYGPKPEIKILPIVLIRSKRGAWFIVQSREEEFIIPHKVDQLPLHLQQVETESERIFRGVCACLDISISPATIESHYHLSEKDFQLFPGVLEEIETENSGFRQFILVTGRNSHFLRLKPSVSTCPYHDWKESKNQNCAVFQNPILAPTTKAPLSFFRSGEEHHCSHKDVFDAKSQMINGDNRSRCGLRSGRNGEAFCEIALFEELLCCRTCIFETVCLEADIFQLPCN